ncbi:hypothetical protein WA158_006332 [Blastocystis sp. Blastoise]
MARLFVLISTFILLASSLSILPGVTPIEYTKDQDLTIYVNGLSSVKAHVPYEYYYLPFPMPAKTEHQKESIGEIFASNHIENSLYTVKIKNDYKCRVIGDMYYDVDARDRFSEIIGNDYIANMLLDNLPVSMKVDSPVETVYYVHGYPVGGSIMKDGDSPIGTAINNHLDFTISYNENPNTHAITIVGFEVIPKSISHQKDPSFTEAALAEGQLSTCDAKGVPVQSIYGEKLEVETQGNNKDKARVIFTYSVTWVPTDLQWSARFDNLLNHDPSKQNNKVHWFSIINSMLIVVFLTGMVGLILLRTLYQDFARYNRLAVDEDLESEREDSGWKMLHADVFRAPESNPMLLTVTIGSGLQVCMMIFITLILALCGFSNPEHRGTMLNIILFSYILLGYFAGYISARFYKTFNGKSFKKNVLLTAILYPSIIFITFLGMNGFFFYVESSAYIPFGTLLTVLFLWLCINIPLVFFGAYKGYKLEPIEAPVATSAIPREIPRQPWYLSPVILYLIGGIVPFGVIFVELYFFLSAIWMGHYYYLFGFLLLVIMILALSTVEISIVITYSLLCAENYHWWWKSIMAPGFSSVYIFCFSIYYFFTSFKIYIFILSVIFFLFTGFIGFIASWLFVMAIFGAVKVD